MAAATVGFTGSQHGCRRAAVDLGPPLHSLPDSVRFPKPRQRSAAAHNVGVRAEAAVAAPEAGPVETSSGKLNKYSSRVTQPKSQGASQAILYGVGLSDDDLQKPQVGISSVWYEGNPCNMHFLKLSEAVKEGVAEAGLVGFRFKSGGVSDAISMGKEGM